MPDLSGLPGLPIAELNRQLDELYNGCDCHHPTEVPDLADGDPDEMAAMLAQMVKQVWKDGGLPEGTINKQVTAAFAKKLWSGVVEGYGKDIVGIDYDSPDYKMLAALQNNVWSFSGAKNYHQLRELGEALIGADGKLVSFNRFKELALAINNKYTVSHLKTEYNLAVAGGQMAGKWEQIKEQRDIFPYLKFDAVLDKQTTDLCRDLDGTTLPIDHPFWKRYYPPNHFNCRSTVWQRPSGPVTPDSKIPPVDIPPMFQTNLGEAGLIFPPKHPYWKDLPTEIKQTATSLIPAYTEKDIKNIVTDSMIESYQKVREAGDKYNLTEAEGAILHDYTKRGYLKLNRALRTKNITDSLRSYERILNAGLEKMPINSEKTVYRATNLSEVLINKYKMDLKTGNTYVEKGFLSTSSNELASLVFADGNKNYPTFFEVVHKTGRSIDELSEYPENEVLFKSKTAFKIIEVKELQRKQGRVYKIILEEIQNQ